MQLLAATHLVHLTCVPFSGTSPNQNFVKNPDVQDMGLSSVVIGGVDNDRSPAAAAASHGARGGEAELAVLLLALSAIAVFATK